MHVDFLLQASFPQTIPASINSYSLIVSYLNIKIIENIALDSTVSVTDIPVDPVIVKKPSKETDLGLN